MESSTDPRPAGAGVEAASLVEPGCNPGSPEASPLEREAAPQKGLLLGVVDQLRAATLQVALRLGAALPLRWSGTRLVGGTGQSLSLVQLDRV